MPHLRLCYNGQQASRTFRSWKEILREHRANGDGYEVTWVQQLDLGTGEWHRVPRERFEAALLKYTPTAA